MSRFLPNRLIPPLSALLLATACAGAWAHNQSPRAYDWFDGYQPQPQTYRQPDPFLDQPASNAQPPLPAGEQPYGKVISVRPNYRQISIPQQVCNDQQVYAGQRNSGVGAIAGAVIGGVLGNGVGHGFGRAAATGVGVVAGSAIGNQLEGGYPSYQTVRQCGTQYVTQDQPDGYTVDYEYAGRRYSTRTDTQPGEWIPLSIQPAASYDHYAPQPYASTGPNRAMPEPGVVVGSGVMPAPAPVYMAPAPAYYAAPVTVQPVIQLGIGGYWGGGHRHWR